MANYKTEYSPRTVSPPGATIGDMLEERGLTQKQLALRAGLAEKTIGRIIAGKQAITPETALELERIFEVPAHFWNHRERAYQDFLARRAEQKPLPKWAGWGKKSPDLQEQYI